MVKKEELAKEESAATNNGEVSAVKATHGNKMLPKVKKQITNITIYRHSIPQGCLQAFYTFETEPVK